MRCNAASRPPAGSWPNQPNSAVIFGLAMAEPVPRHTVTGSRSLWAASSPLFNSGAKGCGIERQFDASPRVRVVHLTVSETHCDFVPRDGELVAPPCT